MSNKDKLIVALDVPQMTEAQRWVDLLSDDVGGFKVGLELYLSSGGLLPETRKPIILDLKLHDIPATVLKAAEAVLKRHPQVTGLTVHVQQEETLRGLAALHRRYRDVTIFGVTVLTSIGPYDMARLGFEDREAGDRVLRLAQLADGAGLPGLVCAPQEVALLKRRFPDLRLLVPGIRPAGAAQDDQKRVSSPQEAVAAGADFLVVGRPILGAMNPHQAARELVAQMG